MNQEEYKEQILNPTIETITINGKEYQVDFPFSTIRKMCNFWKKEGIPELQAYLGRYVKKIDPNIVVNLIYFGIHQHEGITRESIEKAIDNCPDWKEKIFEPLTAIYLRKVTINTYGKKDGQKILEEQINKQKESESKN